MKALSYARALVATSRCTRGVAARRTFASSSRTDGFTEALPRGDVVAPLVFAGIYGFSWWMAEEGRVQALAEKVDINTDPSKNPTPNQVFHHVWPYVAGSLATLFDSVACKFAATKVPHCLNTWALTRMGRHAVPEAPYGSRRSLS